MSKKNDFSDDDVLTWAEEVAERYSDKQSSDVGSELYTHFLQLIKEYRHLLRSFHRVTRISDSYQKSLMETNETLNQAARKDHLTGLSNRRDMIERLTEEVKRTKRYGTPLSMILIDIDYFKKVNDTYGHGAGDKVLVCIADTLSAGIRSADTCARWGGEEFLISLPHTSLEDAVTVAEKLRLTIAEDRIKQNEDTINVTISAGVAEYKEGFQVDDLIRNADDSLYKAKNLGRNRVCKQEN